MKSLLLLGAGQGHVHLLATLAAQPLTAVQITLIAPYPLQLHAGLVSGFVAGHYALNDCLIPLEPLLNKAGVRWLIGNAVALDVQQGTVRLADGSTFGFDWLSIDTGPMQDRQQIEALLPGARENGLFVRPLEAFCALWSKVPELGASRALRIAVLGGSATAIELAMAIRQRLPGSSVTLISDERGVAFMHPTTIQRRLIEAMKQRRITVLSDVPVGIQAEQVLLGSGARLACDVPVIVTGVQVPAWLAGSGLKLDQLGFVEVDAFQRSVSHPQVFVTDDVATRATPALGRNLLAVLAGRPPHYYRSTANTLNFLTYGDRRALVSWRGFSTQGRWVWLLQDWLERRCLRRYRPD